MSKFAKITVTKEKKQVTMLQEQLNAIPVISSEEDAMVIANIILQARAIIDSVEEKRKEYAKPLNELLDKLNSEFKEVSSPLSLIETVGKSQLISYRDSHTKNSQLRLQELREKTGDPELQLDLSLSKLQVGSGEIRFRDKVEIEVTDESVIPKKYMKTVVDMSAIKSALDEKPELSIPGVTVKHTTSPALYVSR